MAVTVDWGTKVITVLQADLTPLGGDNYELDLDWLRLALKDLEYGEEGMSHPDTHVHNTEVTLSGVTYARFIEIINGYTLTISPTGAYRVICVGANHNLADVYNNLSGPTLVIGNAAGLVVTATSGLTASESTWLKHLYAAQILKFNVDDATGILTIWDEDDNTILLQGPIFEDAAFTVPYKGAGLQARGKLTPP